MVAILHKQLKPTGALHRILQVLSFDSLKEVTLNQLLNKNSHRITDPGPYPVNCFGYNRNAGI